MASCTTILLAPPHSETYKWNDGWQSVVTFTTESVTQAVNGSVVVVQKGTVTSGLDVGFTATKTTTDPAFSTVCDSPQGMTTLSGLVTIEFVGL